MTAWRQGLSNSAIILIEKAISRCKIERAYEATSPTIKQTIATLNAIEKASSRVFFELDKLSQIGKAAIFESSVLGRRLEPAPDGVKQIPSADKLIEIGQRELTALTAILNLLAPAAGRASSILSASYSPAPESGQGSNSSAGRDSDLKAVLLDSEILPTGVRAHNAKDKFAVRALLALFETDHFMPCARSEIKILADFLASVWGEIETTPVNFEKVIRQRELIRHWAVRRVQAASLWDETVSVLAAG